MPRRIALIKEACTNTWPSNRVLAPTGELSLELWRG
jgi:hypothetical protein